VKEAAATQNHHRFVSASKNILAVLSSVAWSSVEKGSGRLRCAESAASSEEQVMHRVNMVLENLKGPVNPAWRHEAPLNALWVQ
jgi:hypothetical protein